MLERTRSRRLVGSSRLLAVARKVPVAGLSKLRLAPGGVHLRCHKFSKPDRLRFSTNNGVSQDLPLFSGSDVTQGAKDAVLLGISPIVEMSAFDILERLVKPERTRVDDEGNFVLRILLPQKWWIYADKRPGRYATIARLSRVLVIARESNTFQVHICVAASGVQ